jgi:hypothetical protein
MRASLAFALSLVIASPARAQEVQSQPVLQETGMNCVIACPALRMSLAGTGPP